MDAAAVNHRKPGASDLLLEHCFALEWGSETDTARRPTAADRLEALIGSEMARRLLLALCSSR